MKTIKVTFFILHHFPVVLLPLCLPVVTPQGSAMAPQLRNATSRPAGATSRGSANARARVKRARALVERLRGTTEIRISGTSLHSDGSRGRRDTMGVSQRGDTTGEEQRENDAK